MLQLSFRQKVNGKLGVLIAIVLSRNVLRFTDPLLRAQERCINKLEETAGGTVLVLNFTIKTGFGAGDTDGKVSIDSVVIGPLLDDFSRRLGNDDSYQPDCRPFQIHWGRERNRKSEHENDDFRRHTPSKVHDRASMCFDNLPCIRVVGFEHSVATHDSLVHGNNDEVGPYGAAWHFGRLGIRGRCH